MLVPQFAAFDVNIAVNKPTILQETHCDSEKEKEKWAKEWGSEKQSFWSLGTNRSCGTSVILNKSTAIYEVKILKENEGRIQVLDLHHKEYDKPLRMVNIYAPNRGDDRKLFFNEINTFLKSLPNDAFIIQGGDHNCTLNGFLDRKNCNQTDDAGRDELQSIVNEWHLQDTWRRRNPDLFDYSWKKNKKQSRIDFWLISSSLDNFANVEHLHPNWSDHRAVALTLQKKNYEKGNGMWKMNSEVISH